jgi:hypothetical protein
MNVKYASATHFCFLTRMLLYIFGICVDTCLLSHYKLTQAADYENAKLLTAVNFKTSMTNIQVIYKEKNKREK